MSDSKYGPFQQGNALAYPPFTVPESDGPRLSYPRRVLHGANKDKPYNFNIVEMIVIQASNSSTIDLEMPIRNPAQILARAIIATLEFHVGTKWQRWSTILPWSEIVIEIQKTHIVELVWADSVDTLDVGIGNCSFRVVDIVEIGDTCFDGKAC